MPAQFPALFQPVKIGTMRLKNRVAMAPMGLAALSDPAGVPTQRFVDYFVERARGGAGLLITGMTKVEETLEFTTRRRGPVTKEFVRPFADLTEAIAPFGTKIIVQLSAGFGYQARLDSLRGEPVAPSAIPAFGDRAVTCRALSVDEIHALVKAFGAAAEICALAGVDGIEVHGHAGFLLDQFSSTLWNRRTDRYGGALRDRLRFAFDILHEIRKRTRPDFPVLYRFGLKHYMKSLDVAALPGEEFAEFGRDIDEGLEMARLLEGEGYDGLAIDAGTMTGHYWTHPPLYQSHGCLLDLAALTKQVVNIPVIAVGRLDIPELANQAVAEGKADVISLGRALLADPHWPNKAMAGDTAQIRPCIACHQACSEVIHGREVNSCTVNPAAGRERTHKIERAAVVRDVLVIGGGAAGMEAARVAALRGHRVVLIERAGALGGRLQDASVPADKQGIGRLKRWYEDQLDLLGVDVRLRTEATAEMVMQAQPDAVIVASGALELMHADFGNVAHYALTCTDALFGRKRVGQSVIVVGAGENGCETALWLARQGKQVTLVEKQSKPLAMPIARSNRNMLLDFLKSCEVTVLTETEVIEVHEHGVTLKRPDGTSAEQACDSVVLATGFAADDSVYRALSDYPGLLYVIGDSQLPRNFTGAIWDAFQVARSL